jgi:uncharacterized membrane protein YagU involved in acid resistance
MNADVDASSRAIAWNPVFLAGFLIALADMAFAITVWFSWNATGFEKVFQSIAVGVLGKASYDDGVPAAVLGAALHLFMATTFVAVYTLVARRVQALLSRPLAYGPAYGALLYVVMNFIVMPLSRVNASPSFRHPDWIIYSVIAHMVFGTVCVLAARRALPRIA